MGYVYIAIVVIVMLALFSSGRKLLKELFGAAWRGGSILVRMVFGIVIQSHITVLTNLAPRSLVVKSLEGKETSARKE